MAVFLNSNKPKPKPRSFSHPENPQLLRFPTMRKIRGFKLHKRLIRVTKCILRSRNPFLYRRISQPSCERKTISTLLNWGRRLKNGAKAICSGKSVSGYEPIREKPAEVPKGHLAVYVGQNDGDYHRVFIPVIYFNHPLFGDLLREAEEKYGYEHDGGITIPCRYSEFEKVKTRIAAGHGGWSSTAWKQCR